MPLFDTCLVCMNCLVGAKRNGHPLLRKFYEILPAIAIMGYWLEVIIISAEKINIPLYFRQQKVSMYFVLL